MASTPWQRPMKPLLNRELADLLGDDWALIEDQLRRYQQSLGVGPFWTVERRAAGEALEALAPAESKRRKAPVSPVRVRRGRAQRRTEKRG